MLEALVCIEVLQYMEDICMHCALVIWQIFKTFMDFFFA